MIQEGLRGVVRIPSGTAHALDSHAFPIPVMGKTGTTNSYRDALFVGSTFGPNGITVAVRIGFDDNRSLGARETGALAALPVFREIMLKVYQDKLAGPVPVFPADIESNIDAYLNGDLPGKEQELSLGSPDAIKPADDGTGGCLLSARIPSANSCEQSPILLRSIYRLKDKRGRIVFANE
jgi:membrane carboxypeptidase/penicillin-binding protein